jgi:amino acid transporter
MARHVPKSGDFYSFISEGLGNITGLGAAFLAAASYLLLCVGSYAFAGVSTSVLITSMHGPETPWWLWAMLGWASVSILGYFHIEMSAKILSVAMVIEILIVMIFNVAVLASGGAEGVSAEPFSPIAFAHGEVGVTLLYAILVFMGFEATALFRDEVKAPNVTIPRATYGAVLIVGVLYTLSAYGLIVAYGANAPAIATSNTATMFPDAIGKYVAPAFTQIALVSVIMSALAACVSIHNVLARYIFNLAVDRALPNYLGQIHPRHMSPHRASNAVAFAGALLFLPFIVRNVDGTVLYGRMTGVGSLGVIVLMAMVSASVVSWFVRRGVPSGANVFKVYIAPTIATVLLGAIDVFALLHFELVVGGDPGENTYLAGLLGLTMVAGCLVATVFRRKRPEIYAGLGGAERAAAPLS